jgi:hypothetical protein
MGEENKRWDDNGDGLNLKSEHIPIYSVLQLPE